MAVDQSYAGRAYPPTKPYEVGREKIREFADAINDQNPAYRSVEAARALGYDDVIAPPTFAIVVTAVAGSQLTSDPDFGLDYSRVVHGEQRFVHTRPIRPGDRLQSALTIESIRAAAGNEIVNTRTDVTTLEGEQVLTAYSTIVSRGTAS